MSTNLNLQQRFTNFREFLGDVKKEAAKVSWPGRDEVVGTTTVVVLYTFVMGIYLFGVDAIVTPAVDKLFRAFGA